MIIDSHCHAWLRWPYQPPVPDDEGRGRIEQLLFEMDRHGVDQAVVICARIERNPDNNEYIAEEASRRPARIHQFPDIDCHWTDTYHAPGAADRLRRAVQQWDIKGFTHYLDSNDDGSWLHSEDGLEFFGAASEMKLIASIKCMPHQQPAIRRMAERLPSLPILCHHLGQVHRASEGPSDAWLKEVVESAKLPNIYIKVSGFYSGDRWEYPYSEMLWVVRALYENFGPYRMCWGSDYPPSRSHMTYRQCLDVIRNHCAFMSEEDKSWVLGNTLHKLLIERQVLTDQGGFAPPQRG